MFVTVDKKIVIEQDLTRFTIAVVLIRARTNRLEDIRPLVPQLSQTIDSAVPGRSIVVAAT